VLRTRDETGSVTVVLLLFLAVFVGFAGLNYDGGQRINLRQRAIDEAQAAGRYALRDLTVAHASGELTLDPDAARRDALAYLAMAGHSGQVQVVGTRVTVTVRLHWRAHLLPVLSGDVTGNAVSEPVVGIRGPGG
jgi:hypothetical protein